jgi:hypothetical protein
MSNWATAIRMGATTRRVRAASRSIWVMAENLIRIFEIRFISGMATGRAHFTS